MSGRLRICEQGGWVVNGDSRVPTDPCEYQHPNGYRFVGCNHLTCTRCGAAVRQRPGVACRDDARGHLEELYSTEDWIGLPYMEPAPRGVNLPRLYLCRCTAWIELYSHATEPDDFDSDVDPILPWRCAGHPTPALPLTMNGMRIASDADFDAIVRAIGAGWQPVESDPPKREVPIAWMLWLHAYLLGLPAAGELSRAIARRLGEPGLEPGLVGATLLFFEQMPHAPGVEDVIARAEDALPEALLEAFPVPEAPHLMPRTRRLVDVLLARLGRPSAPDARARAVVRRLLVSRTRTLHLSDDQWRTLVRRDGEWLARSAEKVVKAHGAAWRPLLETFRAAGPEELLVVAGVAMIQGRAVPTAGVRKWLREPGNAGSAWALVLKSALDTADGGAPPPKRPTRKRDGA